MISLIRMNSKSTKVAVSKGMSHHTWCAVVILPTPGLQKDFFGLLKQVFLHGNMAPQLFCHGDTAFTSHFPFILRWVRLPTCATCSNVPLDLLLGIGKSHMSQNVHTNKISNKIKLVNNNMNKISNKKQSAWK